MNNGSSTAYSSSFLCEKYKCAYIAFYHLKQIFALESCKENFQRHKRLPGMQVTEGHHCILKELTPWLPPGAPLPFALLIP